MSQLNETTDPVQQQPTRKWKLVGVVIVLGLILALLVGAVLGLGEYRKGQPEHSLRQFAQAVENRDRSAAEKYIDADRVAESFVDGFMQMVIDQVRAEIDPNNLFEAAGHALGISMLEGMKPQLVSDFRDAIWSAIDKGSLFAVFESDNFSNENNPRIFQNLRYEGFTLTHRNSDKATIGIRINVTSLDTLVVVPVQLERVATGWQVVGFQDLGPILKDLVKLSEKRSGDKN